MVKVIMTSIIACLLLLQPLLLAGFSRGLVCWHCISENCDLNPEENSRAEQKSCLEGQACQKVFFEMQSDIDDTKYRSTVRSCADECIPHNDFNNCTTELYTSRGCVRRACCSDDDLCNTAETVHARHFTSWLSRYLLLATFVSFIVLQ